VTIESVNYQNVKEQDMRKRLWICGFVCCLLLPLLNQASAQTAQGNSSQSEIQRGFEIVPVNLNLSGKNMSLVGLGSYLVNGPADCVGCHTSELYLPGGNPFLGQPARINTATYFSGGVAFGPFISRNLTPDRTGRPAGLTFAEFEIVLRTGADLKALPPHVPGFPGLLQVMPWPQHQIMTDHHMRAIYEYLGAIPCLEGGPGQLPNRCY
jgi:hypothetical protein